MARTRPAIFPTARTRLRQAIKGTPHGEHYQCWTSGRPMPLIPSAAASPPRQGYVALRSKSRNPMTLLSATKFARECFDGQARANRWLSASARELYSPFRDFIPIGLATSYDVHESLGGSASISFGVVQYVVVAFRKREVDLPKEPRLDTRRGDRRGNGRGANPASTAARTASLDGSSSATRRLRGERPSPSRACSKPERVPEPGSRNTQSTFKRSSLVKPLSSLHGCSAPTMITN